MSVTQKVKIPVRECDVSGCNRKHEARSFCRTHYRRFMKHGDPHKGVKIEHGMTNTPPYIIWQHMKQRCYNPNDKDYGNYGGRGIKVCDRWRNSFDNFYKDMGIAPKGMTLNRTDNDGNYEPSNCEWASRVTQNFNRNYSRRKFRRGFRGLKKRPNGWVVQTGQASGKKLWISGFQDRAEAAYVYDQVALQIWGYSDQLNYDWGFLKAELNQGKGE